MARKMVPGKVHGGALGRWFEELCRIDFEMLREVVTKGEQMLTRGALPDEGGVYAFWWMGSISKLRSKECNRKLKLKGPGGSFVTLEIDNEWLGLQTKLPIPLYVGKSAANLSKRVGQHLRLKDERMFRRGGGARKKKAPTTSCQLRAGIEHMFKSEKDTRSLILDNIGFSFVLLDGVGNAANRFYLEDLAIGLMHPPLNVDVER